MSGIQEKITRHAKKYKKKNQSVETDPEMTQITESGHNDVTTAIMNILQMFKKVDERTLC